MPEIDDARRNVDRRPGQHAGEQEIEDDPEIANVIELAAEVKAEIPDASDEERQAECDRRAEKLKQQGLLMEQWDLDRIEADLDRCGLSGSPTKVFRVQAIVLTKEGYTEIPATEEGVHQLIHELVVDRTLG